jgi:GNAT superfamily N-acetyltransferase
MPEAPARVEGSAAEASGVELRPLDAASIPDIVALLERSLGAAPTRTEAFWCWKHLENPFGPSPGIAAFAGDQLVGLRVFLRWRWRAGEEEVRAVRAVDTATDPGWQRRGLFRRMTLALVERMAQEGVRFVFNTPNEKSRAGYLQMGWRDMGRVPILVRPRPASMAWAWLRRRGGIGGHERGDCIGATAADLVAEPRLGPFLACLAVAEPRLHSERTVEYLRWRYAAPRQLGYRAVWIFDGEKQAAVIVRLRKRRGVRELSIAEVLVSPERISIDAGSALLRRLLRSVGHDYAVACAAPSTPERRALLRAGFLPPVRVGPRFTVRPLRPFPSLDPCDHRSWRLSLGDIELF